MLFQLHHIAILCKYAGISFISGSINHGAFSEQRSYLTTGLGIIFYLIGAFLDHKNNPDEIKDWRGIFGLGILASIGLGFFTGGLQHFIDSPERSVWVVPVGFILSVIALYFLEGRKKLNLRSFALYALIGTIIISGLSYAGRQYLETFENGHHSHGHDHSHDD